MTKKGRFTKDRFGFSQPADAPLYAKLPIYYRYVEAIEIDYETDEEAALDLLPVGLELPTPAMAAFLLIRYPFSTLGPYEEAILSIISTWEGEERFYIPHIVVNNDIPQAAGREIWGFPKKMAHITLEKGADLIWGMMERPQGNRIVTAGVRPEVSVEIEEADLDVVSACLRLIPSPEEGAEPSVAELVEVYSKINILEMWQGPGWIQYDTVSMIDPWHKLSVKQIVSATYRIYHQELGYGKIIKRY
jgi:acetoacetate decarboxylase